MKEKLVIVPRKRSTGKKVLTVALFLVTCLMFLLAMVYPLILTVPAVVLAVAWYFLAFQSDIEYEYTYYDGEIRFARIRAKRRRKELGYVPMDDVTIIAPKGDRSVYKYEEDRMMDRRDLTSAMPGARVYELVFKGEKGMCRYEFEPDEEMLDEILIKYPRSVIK